MALNRKGTSGDRKAAATVAFAKGLNTNMGEVTSAEFESASAAGLSDGEIVEVIAVVAINIFLNLLGKSTKVEIDFPKVDLFNAPALATA